MRPVVARRTCFTLVADTGELKEWTSEWIGESRCEKAMAEDLGQSGRGCFAWWFVGFWLTFWRVVSSSLTKARKYDDKVQRR